MWALLDVVGPGPLLCWCLDDQAGIGVGSAGSNWWVQGLSTCFAFQAQDCGAELLGMLVKDATSMEFMPSRWQKKVPPMQIWLTLLLLCGPCLQVPDEKPRQGPKDSAS
jgi:hypothetical protein